MASPRACRLLLLVLFATVLVRARSEIFAANSEASDDDKDHLKDEFFQAVRNDNAEAIRNLVQDRGANINAIGPGGQTPLMHAILQGRYNSVKTLLNLGADVTIGEKDGYTPLHGAGFQGRFRILKLLLAFNNKLHPMDRMDPLDYHGDGYAPIHRACWGREQRHTETIRVFLEEGNVPYDYPSKEGTMPLDMVRSQASIDLLKEWKDKKEKGVLNQGEL